MSSKYFNLDNSNFSKIAVYLLKQKGVPQGLSDISNFTGVGYDKAKVIIKRMDRYKMLNKYSKSGKYIYEMNVNSNLTKQFKNFYGSVIKTKIYGEII